MKAKKKKFIKLCHDVIKADDLSAYSKIVYCALVMYTRYSGENKGLSWPSIPTIQKVAKISEREVYRALEELQSGGWIKKEEEKRYYCGKRIRSSVYKLAFIYEKNERKKDYA